MILTASAKLDLSELSKVVLLYETDGLGFFLKVKMSITQWDMDKFKIDFLSNL